MFGQSSTTRSRRVDCVAATIAMSPLRVTPRQCRRARNVSVFSFPKAMAASLPTILELELIEMALIFAHDVARLDNPQSDTSTHPDKSTISICVQCAVITRRRSSVKWGHDRRTSRRSCLQRSSCRSPQFETIEQTPFSQGSRMPSIVTN